MKITKTCAVSVNGENFSVRWGDLLLDTALANGIDIPFDCRAGQCGTCHVRVLNGLVHGGESGQPGVVRACQCRVISPCAFEVEDIGEMVTSGGVVESIRRLTDRVDAEAEDVVEVAIRTEKPVAFFPGQYMQVTFRGWPPRTYSPTVALDGSTGDGLLRFQIQKQPGGNVSAVLGDQIQAGCRVTVAGPYGSAFLRRGKSNRLVLVSGGTGFAPIWSIAHAAVIENPDREIHLVAGARVITGLYMADAFEWLLSNGNVRITAVAGRGDHVRPPVKVGRQQEHLPELSPEDTVHVGGSPRMVDAVLEKAKAAGAPCFTDPFEPSEQGGGGPGLLSRAMRLLSGAAAPLARKPQPRPAQRVSALARRVALEDAVGARRLGDG